MTVAPAPPAADADQDATYAWRVLSVTTLGATLVGLNTSTLDVGLPAVVSHLHASPVAASWIVLSYMLVNTVLILVLGRAADLLGRRRLYLAGLAVLTFASLGCGVAPNAGFLIAMRVLAAAGGAAIITNTTAQLTDVFPTRLLSRGLGLNVTFVSAAQVAGPVVGGVLVDTAGWRWIFLFNVPVGVLGLVWARRTLRPGAAPAGTGQLDVPGSVLTAVWLGGLVLALSSGGSHGWSSPLVLSGGAMAIVGLPLFLLVQRRVRHPLVDLRLFADRARSMAYLSVFLMAFARFALVLLASLFLQAAQGLSALQAGVRVVPLAVGIMAASATAGRLSERYGARRVSTAGMLISAAAIGVLVVAVSPTVSYAVLGPVLFGVGYGTGTFMTPNTSAIMTGAPRSARGVANGIRSMLQNAGFVTSTAVSLALLTGPLSTRQRQAAYEGRLSRLPGSDLGQLADGFRAALVALLVACLLGAVASLLRGSGAGATDPVPGR